MWPPKKPSANWLAVKIQSQPSQKELFQWKCLCWIDCAYPLEFISSILQKPNAERIFSQTHWKKKYYMLCFCIYVLKMHRTEKYRFSKVYYYKVYYCNGDVVIYSEIQRTIWMSIVIYNLSDTKVPRKNFLKSLVRNWYKYLETIKAEHVNLDREEFNLEGWRA